MKRIAIFASGSGSNAENLYNYFKEKNDIEICLILSNKADAYVLERAKKLNVQSFIFSKKDLEQTNAVLNRLELENIDFLVLAGFLLLMPKNIISSYPNKIINIHPALLPKFGGKGMYGDHVHKAIIESKEINTGITIHYVNEKYDEGNIIFQAKTDVSISDSFKDVAKKVRTLEYIHYPKIIESILSK
jgi:phosphoribosylglycinamide formyltransferase-1